MVPTAMRTAAVAMGLVVGCQTDPSTPDRDTPSTPAPLVHQSVADQDALWALAPDGMKMGVIVSPRGIASLETGALAIESLLASAPELAPVDAEVHEQLAALIGGPFVSLGELGLAHDKGLAAFLVDGGALFVLPVADRTTFLRVAHGRATPAGDRVGSHTCKQIRGVYACGRPAAMLDRLGKGAVADPVSLVRARGEIEIAGRFPITRDASLTIAVVAQLTRGAFVVRAAASGGTFGLPPSVNAYLRNSYKPRVDPAATSGFGVFDLATALQSYVKSDPDELVVSGVTVKALIGALAGPLTVSVPAGTQGFDARLPFNDRALAHALIAQCASIHDLKMFGATYVNGACHLAIPQLGIELDVRIDGGELRLTTRGAGTQGTPLVLGDAGLELASGEWSFAAYGRGTTLAMATPTNVAEAQELPSDTALILRAMSLLEELGIGVRIDGNVVRALATVRTVWANPDDVVDKLIAIKASDLLDGKATAVAQTIANGAAGSLFASDFQAGYGGIEVPTALLSAFITPLISTYVRPTRKVRLDPASPVEADLAEILRTMKSAPHSP
jgi:hypothetical protein